MIQHVLLTAVSFAAERLGQRCFCSQLSSPAMFKVFVKSLMKDIMQDDESNYKDKELSQKLVFSTLLVFSDVFGMGWRRI